MENLPFSNWSNHFVSNIAFDVGVRLYIMDSGLYS